MYVVLYIAVIAYVFAGQSQKIAFVILVEGVGHFQVASSVEVVMSLYRSAEVAVTVLAVTCFFSFAEVISGACCQLQLFGRAKRQALFNVPYPISVNGFVDSLRYIVIVGVSVLHIGLAAPLASL